MAISDQTHVPAWSYNLIIWRKTQDTYSTAFIILCSWNIIKLQTNTSEIYACTYIKRLSDSPKLNIMLNNLFKTRQIADMSGQLSKISLAEIKVKRNNLVTCFIIFEQSYSRHQRRPDGSRSYFWYAPTKKEFTHINIFKVEYHRQCCKPNICGLL